ncbi:hypothetical protein BBO99_00008917 [Phytophthora kernoviae]|uniref:Uncharacterized protein n=2 Tax=Phytophthora kernoviae TaxID=325452 RepID=A0A3R7GR75_9STRA|nr:hypothetical protein G195_010215 [Phytophthora kernoviae 00238/432]KAG2508704.1 hypothetical protein JM16_008744 [Phytophthora kernoviae]KAG2510864.1 hypothetical protein JM18_008538 [Phytophthora kernoviae]RLN37002.1 hypothetical protein BBI17_008936 [Phytophthora kernoviae]RLN74525.1 hypothetical protein BBO99_00008917 [Phytophthora kernoviae]
MYVLSRVVKSADNAGDEKESKGDSLPKQSGWNLLYASGQHYFHGPIELPEDIHVREETEDQLAPARSFFESISRHHEGGVELADIPRLLPLLHAQQDLLTAVDDVIELSSGQRDAVYQMLEVGQFFVEELAKPRTTERLEQDDAVVFQFNQFVYHGSAQLPAGILDDPGALTARGFPLLRAQASDLMFAGVYEELLGPDGEHEAEFLRSKFLSRFAAVHHRFQGEIAPVLMEFLMGAQKWVRDFLAEVPTASGENTAIASHLARWLEVEDGSESFFELELARGAACPFAQHVDGEQQPLDLLVWKGIVHEALLGIIYCHGSFFMTMRPIAESSDVVSDGVLDDDASAQLFAGVPPYLNKGRGYLVRRLPSPTGISAWFAGAKLLLWQTSHSLDREEQDEAQIQASESKTPCKDWFEDTDAKSPEKATKSPGKAQAKPHVLRPVELAEDKLSEVALPKVDKVARPHHVPRLSGSNLLLSTQAKELTTPQPVPWDLRTGHPL